MADIVLAKQAINALKLDADLRAALPTLLGLSDDDALRLHFDGTPSAEDQATAEQIIAAHDATQLTAAQQAALDAAALVASAETRVRDIPQWARISEADALAWVQTALYAPIDTGRTALANAATLAAVKPIVAGMLDMMALYADTYEKIIRMELALRDKAWPNLSNQ